MDVILQAVMGATNSVRAMLTMRATRAIAIVCNEAQMLGATTEIMMKHIRLAEKHSRSGWFYRRSLPRLWFTLLAIAAIALSPHAFGAEPLKTKNILILYSFSDRSIFDPANLKTALRAQIRLDLNFYVEYMEAQRFEDEAYRVSLAETLRLAYRGERLDPVIVESYPALRFVVQYRDRIFPGAPILFKGVHSGRINAQKMWPGVTGATVPVDIQGTINLALRLHSNTNAVAVVTNKSGFEWYWLAAVHSELLRHQDEVREIDIVGPADQQLLEKVAGLRPRTVVLFQLALQDSRHPAMGVSDIVAAIGQRLPIYCIFPALCLNHWGIGGVAQDDGEENALTAKLAARLLYGEPPGNIPVVHGTVTNHALVDWRQLRIPEAALPQGSIVLYREPTAWERDRKYIVAAIVLIVGQSLLIIGLLWQRARNRKAESVLRESEKRFRVLADSTPSLIWMCDQRGKITYLNDRRLAFTGPDPQAGYGDTWTAYLHPDDLERVLEALSEALKVREPFSMEYRLRRGDGVYRWMFDVASPRMNGDESLAGFIGSAIDITDQKLAHEALEKVSGQLIEAQENERSRIARDLHDDICQRLAVLSMELEQANRTADGSPVATQQRMQEIRRYCSEIADDVQSLSHQLHSSKLDYLGIVAAIKGFCKEFARQHGVVIDFEEDRVPPRLPKDVSLCLFRVTQEGLHNAVKYSGTSQFAVAIKGIAGEIELVVRDSGAGFDVEEAKRNRGLGLVSMQERVHLVHGRFSVESKPGMGTRIVVAVPVVIANQSSAAARRERAEAVTGVV